MHIQWKAFIEEIVGSMDLGQSWFMHNSWIVIDTKNQLFLDLNATISSSELPDHIIPIKRISEGDYEINLDITFAFIPTMETIDTSLPEYHTFLGPYSIESIKNPSEEIVWKRCSVAQLEDIIVQLEEIRDHSLGRDDFENVTICNNRIELAHEILNKKKSSG